MYRSIAVYISLPNLKKPFIICRNHLKAKIFCQNFIKIMSNFVISIILENI